MLDLNTPLMPIHTCIIPIVVLTFTVNVVVQYILPNVHMHVHVLLYDVHVHANVNILLCVITMS